MTRKRQLVQPPLTDDEARTEALSMAGAFFQRRVAAAFRGRAPWRVVAEEYPVEFPREGPLPQRETSAIDVWVAAVAPYGGVGRNPALSCQIECKKADPGFTDWVFFRKHGTPLRFRHLTVHRLENEPALVLHEWNLTELLCDDGRELKGNYRGLDRTRSTSSRIQDAARQAALATLSTAFTLMQAPVEPFGDRRAVQLVPVVVTTANLLLCEFPLDQVDFASGQLPATAASYSATDYVVYDYPLTSGLSVPTDRIGFADGTAGATGGDLEELVKMHVLIVNSSRGLHRLVSEVYPLGVLIQSW